MKHFPCLLICSLPISFTALAQENYEVTPYKLWVGGFAEYVNVDNGRPDGFGYLEDGNGIGAEIGYRFNQDWALRFEYSHLDIDANLNIPFAVDESGYRAGFDAMYFFDDDKFYGFAGLKSQKLLQSDNLVNIGIGKHWSIGGDWRLITEAALYRDLHDSFYDRSVKLGIAYTWGSKTAATPTDSDRDGVYDNRDHCPNTPYGTRVDNTGCNIDSDNDGVVNDADNCPNTPAGDKVDSKGCTIAAVAATTSAAVKDSDNDGVNNDQDQCPDTPETDKVDANGCSIFTDKTVTINLNILFANDSAEVTNPGDPQLADFAAFMARFPNTEVEIAGHTSAVGPAEYNQGLSKRRADAVRQLLIEQHNVSPGRITAVGYGESQLLESGDSEAAHRVNRRIEATVSASEKVKVLK